MIRTIDGEPGTYWRNLTPDTSFQWEVFPGCCEVCLRLDRQLVSADFPRELHPNCRCMTPDLPYGQQLSPLPA